MIEFHIKIEQDRQTGIVHFHVETPKSVATEREQQMAFAFMNAVEKLHVKDANIQVTRPFKGLNKPNPGN